MPVCARCDGITTGAAAFAAASTFAFVCFLAIFALPLAPVPLSSPSAIFREDAGTNDKERQGATSKSVWLSWLITVVHRLYILSTDSLVASLVRRHGSTSTLRILLRNQ